MRGERAETSPAIDFLGERYDIGELLGSGGQGDVYRVFDRRLRRRMVMKVLSADYKDDPISIARFVQEAQITAQLQHPSIIPVHEIGALPNGQRYYTMSEVSGRTLATVIAAVHASSTNGWGVEPGGIGFRRLIDTFERVCEAVGYAHACGVVHRDLKPANIMLGAFGEAFVLDWGLAIVVDQAEPSGEVAPPSTSRQHDDSLASEVGSVVGTVGYMSPEQCAGERALQPPSDVYALGMILRGILTGVAPSVAERVGISEPIAPAPDCPVDAELIAICERATAQAIGDRYPDAKALAQAIASYRDGDRKRERARELLGDAVAIGPRIASLHADAERFQREARELLDTLPPSADSANKERGWEREDRARELDVRADLATLEMTRLLHLSLIEAELPETHAMLARHYRSLHEAAELANDRATARLETLLRRHDRGEHAGYLAGIGALTLRTDPPANVELRRYELRGRRLVDEHVRDLGRTPLRAVELPRGSYLLILRAPGCHDVRYPIAIGRQEHWLPIRPGASEPEPIALPPFASIDEDEVYVPGGPFVCGGDPQAAGEVMARQRVWVDPFVMRRNPVTNAELLAMVNALIDTRDPSAEELALGVVPRHRGATAGEAGTLVWPRDASGHFALGTDDEGVTWEPRTPAFMLNWHAAATYAAWHGERTGRPYRLPGELEYEKAARGTDARAFPWGDFFDASWACMRLSHEAGIRPVAVDEFTRDVSPYGVRGLAGNVVEWSADEYRREGPPLANGLYVAPPSAADSAVAERTLRGGCFLFDSFLLRAATRHSSSSVVRDVTLGFRLVRSWT
ncbi:MAG TPA: bifunctional serine/threonine-protein kinase/formylglycine-generating enzyme family protein [Kofleriaceae bacterium]|jgi:serine/threonine-protein kinase